MADALGGQLPEILEANAADLVNAEGGDMSTAMLDRLRLTEQRILDMAEASRKLIALPDPVGQVVRGSVLSNGLQVTQVRVPLGVVAIVYEGRPNVTADAAGLCIKSGNAALLRGSASAYQTNRVLVAILSNALACASLPGQGIQLVGAHRSTVGESDRPGFGRRRHPTWRGRAHRARGQSRHRAGDRDRHRQLSCLRRRRG